MILTIPQWAACGAYVLLALICVAWMFRFRRFALYSIPPLSVAVHGLLFYSSYFLGYTNQVEWSPYLRINGTAVFILMMLLMWEKLASRGAGHSEAQAAARTLVSKAEKVAEAVLATAVIEADATLTRAAKIADEVYERRMANGRQ